MRARVMIVIVAGVAMSAGVHTPAAAHRPG